MERLELKVAANPPAALEWITYMRDQCGIMVEGWAKYDYDPEQSTLIRDGNDGLGEELLD